MKFNFLRNILEVLCTWKTKNYNPHKNFSQFVKSDFNCGWILTSSQSKENCAAIKSKSDALCGQLIYNKGSKNIQ